MNVIQGQRQHSTRPCSLAEGHSAQLLKVEVRRDMGKGGMHQWAWASGLQRFSDRVTAPNCPLAPCCTSRAVQCLQRALDAARAASRLPVITNTSSRRG